MGGTPGSRQHAGVCLSPSSPLQRAVALVIAAMIVTGCSKAIEVPRDQFEATATRKHANHRINLVDGSRYSVKQFAVTDSTIIIEKLNPADSRYNEAKMPIVLPISDVESISRLDLREGLSFAIVATAGVMLILLMNPPDFPATD